MSATLRLSVRKLELVRDLVDRTEESLQLRRDRLRSLRECLNGNTVDVRDLGSDWEDSDDESDDDDDDSEESEDGAQEGKDKDKDDGGSEDDVARCRQAALTALHRDTLVRSRRAKRWRL